MQKHGNHQSDESVPCIFHYCSKDVDCDFVAKASLSHRTGDEHRSAKYPVFGVDKNGKGFVRLEIFGGIFTPTNSKMVIPR